MSRVLAWSFITQARIALSAIVSASIPAMPVFFECCGKHTVFYKNRALPRWKPARERFIGLSVAEDAVAYSLIYKGRLHFILRNK